MIRRRFLAAAAAALTLAACGGDDPVSPDAAVTGAYALKSVNGAPLPYSLGSQGGQALSVTGGGLTLNGDHTYSASLMVQTVSSAGTSTQTVPDVGTYTVSGTALTLTSTSDGSRVTASYANGAVTLSDGAVVLVYQR